MEQLDAGRRLSDDEVEAALRTLAQLGLSQVQPTVHRPAEPSRFREEPGMMELNPSSPLGALAAARVRRAVRFGSDVYLPSWPETVVGLPIVLLQSNLWSAGEAADTAVANVRLGNLDDGVAVFFSGQRLTQYDRRVFAACVNHYRLDRPLTPQGIEREICRTFYDLARLMGLLYTLNTHVAIRNSLLRLRTASLRIRTRTVDLVIERLLEVSLNESYQRRPDADLKGSDPLGFRVPEEFAQLYGLGTWTPVPRLALEAKGLRSWLVAFLATLNRPMVLPFKTLHALSGLACRPNDFRLRLCKALEELQEEGVDAAVRLGHHAISDDGSSITVWKAGW